MYSESRIKRSSCNNSLPNEDNSVKKAKVAHKSDGLEIFVHVISKLNEEQREVVKDLHFSSLLELKSTYVPAGLLHWLLQSFDCATKTLNLPNGFTLTLNGSIVSKILGIPLGGMPIHPKCTLEAYQLMKSEIQCDGRTPSIPELCNMISNDLQGCSFARIFMLLALSSFLCPNTRSVCSTRYYPPLVTVHSIKDRDWCSFVLDWLIHYLSKYKSIGDNQQTTEIGGCCHILMIAYLDFLSTPAFDLGIKCPRISVWSQPVIDAVTFLDCDKETGRKFGILQLKHLCCTPYKDCFTTETCCASLVNDVKKLLEKTSPSTADSTILDLTSDLCKQLQKTVLPSYLPIVSASLHNVLSYLCSNIHSTSTSFVEDTDSEDDKSSIQVAEKRKKPVSAEEMNYFIKYFPCLPVPNLETTVPAPSDIFMGVNLEMINQKDADLSSDFVTSTISFEDLISQAIQKDGEIEESLQREFPVTDIDLLSLAEGKLDKSSAAVQRCSEEKVDSSFLDSIVISIGTRFSEFSKLCDRHIVTDIDAANMHNKGETKNGASKENKTSQNKFFGLSLNERLLGVSSSNHISDSDIPSFDLLDAFDEEISKENITTNLQDSVVEDMQKGFRTCAQLLSEEAHGGKFYSSSQPQCSQEQRFVIANDIEMKFFTLMTSNIQRERISQKIFQHGYSYVDKYKLALSMMNGGWMHVHVMDCFSKMLSSHQQLMKDVEGHVLQLYFEQNVVVTLMKPNLEFDHYKKDYLEKCCGLNLTYAGLVYIPCFFNTQWILIVANFLEKRFDILDSDSNVELGKKTVHSVIYNFRKFFHSSFPNCLSYNIDDFGVKYVTVPKHNIRNDSGIFVLQFMQTYNGSTVSNFTNADVKDMRAKFLFQLTTSQFNQTKSPFVQKFLSEIW